MSWRFIFTRNRWQKALAIFLATMIWLTVRSGSLEGVGEGIDDELEIRVPVAVLASPSDTGTYQLSPSMVSVTLQLGTKSAEHRPPDDLEVFVNVVGEESVDGPFSLHVHLPDGVRVRKVFPKQVNVKRLSTNEPSR